MNKKNLLELTHKKIDVFLDEITLKKSKNKVSVIKKNIVKKTKEAIDSGKVEAREVGGLVNQLKREGGTAAPIIAGGAVVAIILPGGTIASLITYAGYKNYVRNFSRLSKKCDKARSSKEKDLCIKHFKRLAVERQITDLKSALSSCNQPKDITNNKYKCMRIIGTKIKKLEKRADYLKKKESSIVL